MYTQLTLDDFFMLLKVLPTTIALSAAAMLLGTCLAGLIAGLNLTKYRILKGVALIYNTLFRGTPLLMQIFFIFFGLPALGISVSTLPAALAALTLFTGAYMSEIIRGGILAVPKNQTEAADSLGLSLYQKIRYVVLPQAFKIIIPPAMGYTTSLVKNSALVSTIGFLEVARMGRIITERTSKGFIVFGFVSLLYFAICYPLSKASQRLEGRRSQHK